jgi:hypothetical protein
MKCKKWCQLRCQTYLARVDVLIKQILVCVHSTGGLPGRGTEVTTIKWCNTRQVMRNIFVYDGRLITVIEYNKTRASTNNSFYIVRVLPLVVSKILFQYIAYVRPFCEALVHQLKLQRSKVPAYYLFASRDYVYSSDILSRAINVTTQEEQGSRYVGRDSKVYSTINRYN